MGPTFQPVISNRPLTAWNVGSTGALRAACHDSDTHATENDTTFVVCPKKRTLDSKQGVGYTFPSVGLVR